MNSQINGKCYDCEEPNIDFSWCQDCKPLEIIPTFPFWTSGNHEIDQLIQVQLKPVTNLCEVTWHGYLCKLFP